MVATAAKMLSLALLGKGVYLSTSLQCIALLWLQLLDKMVGQERIADEVKIILKPFYCKGTINKDEYKHIMRNCVTKVCPLIILEAVR